MLFPTPLLLTFSALTCTIFFSTATAGNSTMGTHPFLEDICRECTIKPGTASIMICQNCRGYPLEGDLSNIIHNKNGVLALEPKYSSGLFEKTCTDIVLKNFVLGANCRDYSGKSSPSTLPIGKLLRTAFSDNPIFLIPAAVFNSTQQPTVQPRSKNATA